MVDVVEGHGSVDVLKVQLLDDHWSDVCQDKKRLKQPDQFLPENIF